MSSLAAPRYAEGSPRRSQSIRRSRPRCRRRAAHRGDERIVRAAPLDRRLPDERLRLVERHRPGQRQRQRFGQRDVAGRECCRASAARSLQARARRRRRDWRRHRSARPSAAARAIRAATRGSIARAPGSPRRAAPRAARRSPARRRPSSRCQSGSLCAASCCCRRATPSDDSRTSPTSRLRRAGSRSWPILPKLPASIASQLPYSTIASRWVCHGTAGAEVELAGQRLEHRRAAIAERRKRACRAAELDDEQPRLQRRPAAASVETAARASWPPSNRT